MDGSLEVSPALLDGPPRYRHVGFLLEQVVRKLPTTIMQRWKVQPRYRGDQPQSIARYLREPLSPI